MPLGRGKNRRRVDAAERAAAVTGLAGRLFSAAARVLAACAMAAALFFGGRAAYQWALSSPTFALKTLTFHGLRRASEGELCRLAGLAPGQNLFQMEPEALSRAMMAHPWVQSVTLRRQLPAAVVVVVTEQEPAAVVSLGDLYLLNGEGEPFKRLQAGEAVDLPLVTGVDRDAYMASPQKAVQGFKRALGVVAAYDASDRGAGPRLSEVRIEPDGYTLVSSIGVEVRLGDGAPADELARLSRVASELSRRGLTAEVIRLDNRVRPGWVTVKTSKPGFGR